MLVQVPYLPSVSIALNGAYPSSSEHSHSLLQCLSVSFPTTSSESCTPPTYLAKVKRLLPPEPSETTVSNGTTPSRMSVTSSPSSSTSMVAVSALLGTRCNVQGLLVIVWRGRDPTRRSDLLRSWPGSLREALPDGRLSRGTLRMTRILDFLADAGGLVLRLTIFRH